MTKRLSLSSSHYFLSSGDQTYSRVIHLSTTITLHFSSLTRCDKPVINTFITCTIYFVHTSGISLVTHLYLDLRSDSFNVHVSFAQVGVCYYMMRSPYFTMCLIVSPFIIQALQRLSVESCLLCLHRI